MSEKYYNEMKIRINWDIAWRIFDHVNEKNDTKKHIDLNCLDITEACSITQQQIYDIAKSIEPKKSSFFSTLMCGYGSNQTGLAHHVLSIQCAQDHII